MRYLKRASACALAPILTIGCASEDRDQPREEAVVFSEPDAFFALMNMTGATYLGFTREEMIEQSDQIALGKITDVEPGMVEVLRGDSVGIPRFTIEVTVDTLLEGEPRDGRVYFEYWGGGMSAATWRANLPQDDVLVFLTPAPREAPERVEYRDPFAGYPQGVTPRILTNPQGLLVERDGVVVQILAEADDGEKALFPQFELFPDSSMQEAVGALKEDMAEELQSADETEDAEPAEPTLDSSDAGGMEE